MAENKTRNEELTTGQKEALRAYREHVAKYRKAPSLRELAAALGVLRNTASHYVQELAAKGYLEEGRPITLIRMRLSAKGRKVEL